MVKQSVWSRININDSLKLPNSGVDNGVRRERLCPQISVSPTRHCQKYVLVLLIGFIPAPLEKECAPSKKKKKKKSRYASSPCKPDWRQNMNDSSRGGR